MSPLPPGAPLEWVPANIIRQMFNEGQYVARVESGELVHCLKKNHHLDPPPRGEPYCTHSQIVYYCTREGATVAVVHQYMRPDGTLGASGLPDPKCLILPDRVVRVLHEHKPPCTEDPSKTT